MYPGSQLLTTTTAPLTPSEKKNKNKTFEIRYSE
jgi:hypothetical protein